MYPFILANAHQDITFRWRYVLTMLPLTPTPLVGDDPAVMQGTTAVTGLTPTVTITDPNGTVLINQVYATEEKDGWYNYTLPKAQVALDGWYTATAFSASHDVDAQTLAQFARVVRA